MSRSRSAAKPEKAFEDDDINPEIIAAIDEIHVRRDVELDAAAKPASRSVAAMSVLGIAVAVVAVSVAYISW